MAGFLLDENLPASLIPILAGHGLEASHVEQHGFKAGPDTRIWDFALDHRLAIVTKDSDYLDLAAISRVGRVVLLAVGNPRLRELHSFMDSHGKCFWTSSPAKNGF